MDASGPQAYSNNDKEVAPTVMPPAAQEQHYPAYENYAYGAQEAPKPEKKIFGLRVVTFILSMALVLVIIIAAVGAGVGASQAVQSARDDARTSAAAALEAAQSTCSAAPSVITITETATVTTSGSPSATSSESSTSEISVPREGSVALDCPNLNGTTQSITIEDDRWMFDASCSRDVQGRGLNIMSVVAYHFQDCLVACASYNRLANADDCVAVAFNRNLQVVRKQLGNCWLKNGTGTLRAWSNDATANTYIAARLVGRGSGSS